MPLIIWDAPKRLINLDKHKLDFSIVTEEFLRLVKPYPVRDGRLWAMGALDGVGEVIVIYKPLGSEAISIISLRKAGAKDRRLARWQDENS